MGLHIGFSNCSCYEPTIIQRIKTVFQPSSKLPDASNFYIENLITFYGKSATYTIALIEYPDCNNYKGKKILVFDTVPEKIYQAKKIDPHFCESCSLSPIARFRPTKEGWDLAVKFAKTLIQE